MIFKTILVVCLAVGVFAEKTITEEQFNNIINKNNSTEEEDITKAIRNYVVCVRENFDVVAIKNEIEAAKNDSAALRKIYRKFCEKSFVFKNCLPAPTTALPPCPGASVDEGVNSDNDPNEQLVNFLCENDGDKLSSFYVEGGPECFDQSSTSIRECAKKQSGKINSFEDLKKLTVLEQCTLYDNLSVCILKPLEKCQSPTVHSVIESLLQHARKSLRLREIIMAAPIL